MRSVLVAILCSSCQLAWKLDDCGTFDEDGDKILNGCDPCPSIAGVDLDADGDGTPDICDPEPDVKGTGLQFFDGLDDEGTWLLEAGPWEHGDSTFAIAMAGQQPPAKLTHSLDAVGRPAVEIVVESADLAADGTFVGGIASSGGTEGGCNVSRVAGQLEIAFNDGSATPAMITGSGTLRISGGQLSDDKLFCSARFDDTFAVVIETAPFVPGKIEVDRIGFQTNTTATFKSIAVYGGRR